MTGRRAPLVVGTRGELDAALAAARQRGARVALVPTMGALHEGHASLMAAARQRTGGSGVLVASVFVNPLQFGPGEDLNRYPRTFEADLGVCAAEGVDVVFAPSVEEVYPGGAPQVSVDPGPLGTILEGRSRPTHFSGVLTVVAKLFGLARPDLAVFGEKDYQQLVLIRRMVSDLCMPVGVVGAPTLREPGGLALSSRNRYLTAEDREAARSLSRALRAVQDAAGDGADAAMAAARRELDPAIEPDYLELTSADLGPVPAEGQARVLVAARVGSTRLIDNLPVLLGAGVTDTTKAGSR